MNEQQDWLGPRSFVHVVNSVPVEDHPFVRKRIGLSIDPVGNAIANERCVQVQFLCSELDSRSSKTGCLIASSTKSAIGASGPTLKRPQDHLGKAIPEERSDSLLEDWCCFF